MKRRERFRASASRDAPRSPTLGKPSARGPEEPAPPSLGWREWLWFALPAGLVLLVAYPDALRIAFLNDDFVFLDRTRNLSVIGAFENRGTPFLWYRPWSRELHYLLVQKVFGSNPVAFHGVSVVLFASVAVAYGRLVLALAGGSAARFAVCGFLAMSAWAVPVLWVAGVQDLWMLLAAWLYLEFQVRLRSPAVTTVLLAIALLSKETAALLPLMAAVLLAWSRGLPWRRVAARVLPGLPVLALWMLIHPRIGGRLLSVRAPTEASGSTFDLGTIPRTVLSAVNLDFITPLSSLTPVVLGLGALLGILLGVFVWHSSKQQEGAATLPVNRGAFRATLGWAVLGWLPAMASGSAWHSYYGLLGAAGAWALVGVLVKSPVVRAGIVFSAAVLGIAFQAAPSTDWGRASYLRRSSLFVDRVKGRLQSAVPRPAPHSRMFFLHIPYYVGFVTPGAPVLRVWYADSTIRGGFWSDYAPRAATSSGRDYFFRFDSTGSLVEVVRGPERIDVAERTNPRWARDHEALAAVLAKSNDWEGAAEEYAKLITRHPEHPDYLFNAGIAFFGRGDSARGADLVIRAARAPGASAEIRAGAASLSSPP